jgi:hypothetical protein
MLKRKEKKLHPPTHFFTCVECDKEKEIDSRDFNKHLEEIHGIFEKTGSRELILHINKRPRHSSIYKWEIGGKTFYEYYN